MNKNHTDYGFKIVVCGRQKSGKSLMLQRFVKDDFYGCYLPTNALDFKSKIFEIDDSIVKIQAYDTSGQENFKYIIFLLLRFNFHIKSSFLLTTEKLMG